MASPSTSMLAPADKSPSNVTEFISLDLLENCTCNDFRRSCRSYKNCDHNKLFGREKVKPDLTNQPNKAYFLYCNFPFGLFS